MSRPPAPGRSAGPRARPRRRPARQRRRAALVVLLTLAFLVVVALAAFSSSPSALESGVPASSSRLLPAGQPRTQVIAVEPTTQLRLQLPIAQDRVTAIGYHAMGEDAMPLEPVGRQANEGLFPRLIHRIFGGGGGGISWYALGGRDIGASTGAVDIGAAAGTDVYAPVGGTIVGLRDYILDGKAFGSVIEIEPQGSSSSLAVVSVTHLRADPSLTVGSSLTAGASKLGTVVDFSRVERQALAAHTQDAGNHVTLEVVPAARTGLN